jgi:hypothetical protein
MIYINNKNKLIMDASDYKNFYNIYKDSNNGLNEINRLGLQIILSQAEIINNKQEIEKCNE